MYRRRHGRPWYRSQAAAENVGLVLVGLVFWVVLLAAFLFR